jgi:hypothetical protein
MIAPGTKMMSAIGAQIKFPVSAIVVKATTSTTKHVRHAMLPKVIRFRPRLTRE